MRLTCRRLGLLVVLVAAACSAGEDPGTATSPIFGAAPGPCGVTVLTNDDEDRATLRESVACAIAEVDARRTFTWDLLVPTVEGDPILYRYSSDGELVTIIADTTRDSFGSGSVLVQVCETIDDTGFVPLGVDCTDTNGIPFELPDEVWPP